ncbi:rRNA methyltransferase 3, mitochondrial [Anticarsia gemmatalis]|uniref:rRNA methyltransferase 3, mitochondrial n=1 Tax=Anticarsia gemmatalis TaxID=129554 RepID=UPI003F778135
MSTAINRFLLQTFIRQSPARGSVRLYGRWMHRSPAKVLLPTDANSKPDLKKEKIIDLDPAILTKKESKQKDISEVNSIKEEPSVSSLPPEKARQIKLRKEEKLKKQKFYLSQQKVFDDNGDVIYEKLKESDPRVSMLLVKLKSKKERLRLGQTLVEGWRLIVDGLEANCKLRYLIFSRPSDLEKVRPFLPKTGARIYKIPYKEMQLWSDVETSPGIFGVFETPTAENVKSLSKSLPIQFVCDNIRVPGNLGAILRVAVGAGCEKVLLSKGCVDVWDPKVIRSAAGAHFRLPIYHSIEWTDMPSHLEPNTSVFIADSNTTSAVASDDNEDLDLNPMPVLPYYGVEFSSLKHTTLILGGETEGISQDSYLLAASKNGLRLNIPLQRGVDSLNTGMATAVIAFEIRKQLIQALRKEKYGAEVQAN